MRVTDEEVRQLIEQESGTIRACLKDLLDARELYQKALEWANALKEENETLYKLRELDRQTFGSFLALNIRKGLEKFSKLRHG